MNDNDFKQCLKIHKQRKLARFPQRLHGDIDALFSLKRSGGIKQRIRVSLKYGSLLVLCVIILFVCTGIVAVTITKLLERGATLLR